MRKKCYPVVHPRYRELVRGLEAYLARKAKPGRWLGISVAADPRLLPNLRRGQRYPDHIMQELAARAGVAVPSDAVVGDIVVFQLGHGLQRKTMIGDVVGFRDAANGRWVAVRTGQGFHTEFHRVRPAAILPDDTTLPLAA